MKNIDKISYFLLVISIVREICCLVYFLARRQ
jgi:hypothetical protein